MVFAEYVSSLDPQDLAHRMPWEVIDQGEYLQYLFPSDYAEFRVSESRSSESRASGMTWPLIENAIWNQSELEQTRLFLEKFGIGFDFAQAGSPTLKAVEVLVQAEVAFGLNPKTVQGFVTEHGLVEILATGCVPKSDLNSNDQTIHDIALHDACTHVPGGRFLPGNFGDFVGEVMQAFDDDPRLFPHFGTVYDSFVDYKRAAVLAAGVFGGNLDEMHYDVAILFGNPFVRDKAEKETFDEIAGRHKQAAMGYYQGMIDQLGLG